MEEQNKKTSELSEVVKKQEQLEHKIRMLEILTRTKYQKIMKYTAFLQTATIVGIFIYAGGALRTLLMILIAMALPAIFSILCVLILSWKNQSAL